MSDYLNETLRLMRKTNDFSVTQMAQLLDVSPSYVSKIESGSKSPNREIIDKYAAIFKVKPSTLYYISEIAQEDHTFLSDFSKFVIRISQIVDNWGKV